MPNRHASPPKYRHYKPKNLAVVRIDGRDHYLGKHGSPESWEKYHRLLAERAVSSTASSIPPDPAELPGGNATVAEVMLAFWEYAEKHYRHPDGSPSDEIGNIKAALRPLCQLYALTLARDFGPLALRAVRQQMVEAGLARSSVNARINRVRRAFRWAASVELVPVSVVSALDTVAGLLKGRSEVRESDPVGPVSAEVIEATLPFLSHPVAGLVRLQLLTGMRPGEAMAMRGMDLKAGESNWTYTPASHKTAHLGKGRSIPLGPKAVELVKSYLTTDLDAYLFRPCAAVAEHHARRADGRKSRPTPSERARREPTPGAKHSARYRRHTYRNAINRACDRAFPHPTLSKVPNRRLADDQRSELVAWRKAHCWHPNQLRHSAATAIRSKYGLEAAQVILGHSRADTTQIYAERDLAKAHDVMREIG